MNVSNLEKVGFDLASICASKQRSSFFFPCFLKSYHLWICFGSSLSQKLFFSCVCFSFIFLFGKQSSSFCEYDILSLCWELRNLYAGQEATVRTGHGPTDWFQIGKGVRQGCILSPCLFNIMRNAGLEDALDGIKIARRNINNLRYADDTTLMAESEEELKAS